MKKRQISMQLPEHVIKKAAIVAKQTERPDGLKQTLTATLRDWLLKGMTYAEPRS